MAVTTLACVASSFVALASCWPGYCSPLPLPSILAFLSGEFHVLDIRHARYGRSWHRHEGLVRFRRTGRRREMDAKSRDLAVRGAVGKGGVWSLLSACCCGPYVTDHPMLTFGGSGPGQ